MARLEIFPSVVKYQDFLLGEIEKKHKFPSVSARPEEEMLTRISSHFERFFDELSLLEENLEKYPQGASQKEKAFYAKDTLLSNIERLRQSADAIELLTGKQFMPYPSYEDILYSVKY